VLLTLGSTGDGANVVEIRRGEARGWRCPSETPWQAIGALAQPEGWTVVTKALDRIAVPGPTCREILAAPGVKEIAE